MKDLSKINYGSSLYDILFMLTEQNIIRCFEIYPIKYTHIKELRIFFKDENLYHQIPKSISTLDKKDQMDDSLNRILDLGREVAIVKICDRITNLQRPPKKWDNAKIKKYHLQALKIAERLQGKNEYLDKRIQEKILSYNSYF